MYRCVLGILFLGIPGLLSAEESELTVSITCQVNVSEKEIYPGDWVNIQYIFTGPSQKDVSWLVLPPVWSGPEGLSFKQWEQVVATDRQKNQKLVWIAHVKTIEPGSFSIPPMQFRAYSERDVPAGAVDQSAESLTGVNTPAVTVAVRRKWTAGAVYLAVAGVGVSVLVGAVGWAIIRKQRRYAAAPPEDAASMLERWHRARRLRLDGDIYGALKELLAMCEDLGAPKPLTDQLYTAAQDAGFRNKMPDPESLEGWFALAEKMMREKTPQTDNAKRTGKPA